MSGADFAQTALAFEDLPGWAQDDHAAAYGAFLRSCRRIVAVAAKRKPTGAREKALVDICRQTLAKPAKSDGEARAFFEENFTPRRVNAEAQAGFLTGYFEPVIKGSRKRSDQYPIPVYAKPKDLVRLMPDEERGARNTELTAMRRTASGQVPYPTREEIEKGALEGSGLELLYLADPVDAYVMHVQGSGQVELDTGERVRLGYAAKNGHPYTSIGKELVQRGEIALEDMSLETMTGWLRDNPDAARELMWLNRSFIFFQELGAKAADEGPDGAQGVALTAGRSLAVDPSHHSLGTPIWVESPSLDADGTQGFARLMVAQDVGSAIKGPERGDIYWGSGDRAGRVAGLTRHKGSFIVLEPKRP